MKWIALLSAMAMQCACAAPPSREAVFSCLSAQPVSHHVKVTSIQTNEVMEEDNYKQGYNATYLLKHLGRDIGYAERDGTTAIIYDGRIYPTRSSRPLLKSEMQPDGFQPSLAEWSFVEEGRLRYFCVSYNFEGLGQSGSYQNVRGGYLLPVGQKGDNTLYYAVADIRTYRRKADSEAVEKP